jgi:hypothetical protein
LSVVVGPQAWRSAAVPPEILMAQFYLAGIPTLPGTRVT